MEFRANPVIALFGGSDEAGFTLARRSRLLTRLGRHRDAQHRHLRGE